MNTASIARGPTPIIIAATLAFIAGLFAVVFGDLVQLHPTLFIAPLVPIGALLLLLLDKRKLFYVLMLSRASLDPLLNTTKLSGSIGVGALLNGFMILLGALFMIDDPRLRTRKMLMVWLPMLTVMGVTSLYAPEFGPAFRLFLSTMATAAVFYVGASLVRDPADLRRMIYVVLLSAVAPALYAFVDAARNFGAVGESGFRLMSTFTHPNILAFYLVLVLALQLYLLCGAMAETSPSIRTLLYAGIPVVLVLIMLTGTRSAWLAAAVLLLGYGSLFDRRWLILALLVPLFALLIPGIQDRVVDLLQGNNYAQGVKLNSFAWRQMIWEKGIGWMSPTSYLTGNGLNSFVYYSPYFFPLAGDMNPGAHNVYVQLLFETGVVGVMAFLWQQIGLLRTVAAPFALDRNGTMLMCSTVVVYVTVALSDNLISYLAFNWYYWLIGGAAWSYAAVRIDGQSR